MAGVGKLIYFLDVYTFYFEHVCYCLGIDGLDFYGYDLT